MATKKTSSAPTATPFRFRLKREITLSSWKWEPHKTKYFRVMSAIREGSQAPGATMEPAKVCDVLCLETDKHYQLVLGKIIYDAMVAAYPGEEIIGHCFSAAREAVPGKKYFKYEVNEIEDPGDES